MPAVTCQYIIYIITMSPFNNLWAPKRVACTVRQVTNKSRPNGTGVLWRPKPPSGSAGAAGCSLATRFCDHVVVPKRKVYLYGEIVERLRPRTRTKPKRKTPKNSYRL